MKFIKAIVSAGVTAAIVWFIPLTAKAIEALIKSAVLSLGTAQNLLDVDVALAKGILALALWILLLVLFRKRD
jgi:hypothetical protein